MIYVLDTNIFLRVLINEEEKSFQASLGLLKEIKQKKHTALVPDIVLSEIVWTLKSYYGFPKPKIIEAVQSILNLRGVEIIDGYNYRTAFSLFKENNVKYINACIASLPVLQNGKAIVVSYDHDFDKLGISRQEPK